MSELKVGNLFEGQANLQSSKACPLAEGKQQGGVYSKTFLDLESLYRGKLPSCVNGYFFFNRSRWILLESEGAT